MKTLYELKLRKAKIDAEREADGLEPVYARYEKEQPAKRQAEAEPDAQPGSDEV